MKRWIVLTFFFCWEPSNFFGYCLGIFGYVWESNRIMDFRVDK